MATALYELERAGTGGSHKLGYEGIPYRFDSKFCSRANCQYWKTIQHFDMLVTRFFLHGEH
jgi:hypothetical protein